MPKIELHCHLDGSFDEVALFAAAKRRLAMGDLPPAAADTVRACGDDLEAFKCHTMCIGDEEKTLKAMIDKFIFFLPIVQGDLECLEDLARRYVGRQAAQNIIYTEVRYSPHILTRSAAYGGVAVDETGARGPDGSAARDEDEARAVVEAVTRGLRAGVAEHPGIEIAQILCFLDAKPEWAEGLVGARRATPPPAHHPTLFWFFFSRVQYIPPSVCVACAPARTYSLFERARS